MPSLISKFWTESRSLTPPPLPLKPFALIQSSASVPNISAHRFERSQT
ncbi:15011_t:CDS:2 [Funneliformis caledonium]|uniref:15011_t:CDS:1 n=1 Tax=Funneliformis caledonium TaxID=1117310 RepID=A0A9N9ER81_9GLOM|nr:15011_t:CDS:2 [Funneliformis caledonium]